VKSPRTEIFDELRAIQDRYGYLPADQLRALSARMEVPLYRIHGVASFYPHFHLKPPPKAILYVCCDMSCHCNGADDLREGLVQRFASLGENQVQIKRVSCLGQCDGAPAVAIRDHYYRNVTSAQAEALVLTALGGASLPDMPVEPARTGLAADPYNGKPRYGAVRKLLETRDYDGVIAQLKAAALPGMGGAGFLTGLKWELVRKAPGDVKYVVCNADESEPGTIKDRYIMHHLPHLVIEGMILAGLVTGAKQGVFYIRHEYPVQEHIIEHEIEHCYKEGLLGDDILGSGRTFHLEMFVSPGGYICGEESALIEAIEGKRGEPRNKPPFPVFEGLWHKPTALNNVETFANVPQILVNGVEWFKAQGVNGCAGLKFVGVSGDVVNPGVFLVPMGTPASDVILGLAGGIKGGKRFKGWAPSGPSSGYLPASMADALLDFKTLAGPPYNSMLGSGAIVVCSEDRCMLDMAINSITFFRNESCGKCVPCRMGTQKLVDILTGWTQGKGTPADIQLVDELSEALKQASICGLGQFAHMPITSVMANFRQEVEEHILNHRCPAGVCSMRAARGTAA
jgi:NADH:ubiquinone oxidoreductase subunit F (NADH-binding)/NADH:ubiquinone oxidoreductase subunit E